MAQDEPSDAIPRRAIFEVKEQVRQARSEYYAEVAANNSASEQTRWELATAAIEYYDILSDYRDEDALDLTIRKSWAQEGDEDASVWEKSGAEELRSCLGRTATVEQEQSGFGASVQQIEKPMLLTISPEFIIQVTKRLDDIAKRLGFAARAAEKTHVDKLTREDAERIFGWNLSGDKEAVTDGGDDNVEG